METRNLTDAGDAESPLTSETALLKFSFLAELLMIITILSPVWIATFSFGLVSNIINIIVFLKAVAKDNVTVLMLALAVSDLMYLCLCIPSVCSFVILGLFRSFSWPFDIQLFRFLLYWPSVVAYDLSSFISVSLGVIRCACIAMPLKFKFVFTRSRTVKWVMCLVVLAVSLRLPVLTVNRITWITDPKTNTSSARLLEVNREFMVYINDILNRNLVIYVTFITMVTCVCVLTFKLYQASKIRRSFTSGFSQTPSQAKDKPTDQGLTAKDLQVVKSVVVVCVIFILSQLPFLLVSTTRLIEPEFDDGTRWNLLFGIFGRISRTCSYLNASLNIFVYYNYNSKYRSVLLSFLCIKGKQ
ncbi:chemosensory receptor A [Elysia marginata]|uniref:Chemosensory receptor A n=1 Tax=Elysia marginata TaxID=1093978 RepID=A0AAV4JJB4_9GAST|nr:chemosensory receptor A [Elysia marginata]